MFAEYKLSIDLGKALFKKDGHTMFSEDVLRDLQRKSYLEKIKKTLESAICIYCREELSNMNFETDKEAIDYILSFHE